jgi:hypothetical protein
LSQLFATEDVKEVHLKDVNVENEIGLSPKSVYEFTYNHTLTAGNDSLGHSGTELSVTFSYFWSNECDRTTVCNVLSGNPCGDYSLEVATDGFNKQICHAGTKVLGHMHQNVVFNVSLWISPVADNFELSCYTWCSADGGLPENDDDIGTGVSQELLQTIVS